MSLPWFVQGYLPAVVREQYSMVLDLSYMYIEIVLPVQLAKHFFVKLITKKCRRTLISVNAKHWQILLKDNLLGLMDIQM